MPILDMRAAGKVAVNVQLSTPLNADMLAICDDDAAY